MAYKVFVDGQEGTTGLKIHSYLAQRPDLDTIRIDPEKRKDTGERRRLINEADLVFLCLPDAAAREAATVADNPRIIDASTAHRTHPDWTYGLPELDGKQRDLIRASRRVSVPGCHATAFVLALHPLVAEGVVGTDYPVTCCSVTGYSGGGRKMIEDYEGPGAGSRRLHPPRPYALALSHKHVPEMQKVTGLINPPLFTPIVANYAQGLAVSIPLFPRLFAKKATARDIRDLLAAYYAGERFIRVMPCEADDYLDNGYFDITACNGTNRADLFVFGGEEQILLMTRLDNLGKGASGAAVQNMNIMLGLPEDLGLSADGNAGGGG